MNKTKRGAIKQAAGSLMNPRSFGSFFWCFSKQNNNNTRPGAAGGVGSLWPLSLPLSPLTPPASTTSGSASWRPGAGGRWGWPRRGGPPGWPAPPGGACRGWLWGQGGETRQWVGSEGSGERTGRGRPQVAMDKLRQARTHERTQARKQARTHAPEQWRLSRVNQT